MMKLTHVKNDLKLLARDPIMFILFLAPILMFIVFKLILVFLVPFSQRYIQYELSDYKLYILSLILVLTPGLLGIVIGFLMLDDRDGSIAELMSVTPLGRSGYLFHRLSFSFVATAFYAFLGYYILNILKIHFLTLALLAILMGIYSMIIGLIVSIIATDKVKGLTYAKGLNIFMLFIFTDLTHIDWLITLAKFTPTYWVPKIIEQPQSIFVWAMAFLIHIIYLTLLLIVESRSKTSL